MPKEVLVYSGPTHCNNNSNSELYTERKEKRLTVDSALERRALDNCCLTCLLKENYLQEEVVSYSLGTILGLSTTVETLKITIL